MTEPLKSKRFVCCYYCYNLACQEGCNWSIFFIFWTLKSCLILGFSFYYSSLWIRFSSFSSLSYYLLSLPFFLNSVLSWGTFLCLEASLSYLDWIAFYLISFIFNLSNFFSSSFFNFSSSFYFFSSSVSSTLGSLIAFY